MSAKQNIKHMTLNIAPDVLGRLDAIADYAGISRHQFIVNILEVGIEEIRMSKYVGLFHIALAIRNTIEAVKGTKERKLTGHEKPIPVRMDESFLEKLDLLAEQGGISRQRLALNIIDVGLEEAEALKRYGVMRGILFFRDLPDRFRAFINKGEKAYKAEIDEQDEK